MRHLLAEITDLASTLRKAGALAQSERLYHAAEMVHQGNSDEDPEETDEWAELHAGEKLLDEKLTKLKKGGWWLPPHNYVINMTLMGTLNGWTFSLLPMFPEKNSYKPANDHHPEGLVIDPGWHQDYHDPARGESIPCTVKVAEALIRYAGQCPTVGEEVKAQLRWVETKFGVSIPSNIESKLVQDAPKVAARRWGVNRLRAKKILVPFDGSKAMELSSWGW